MGLENLSNKGLIKMFALEFPFYPKKFFSGASFQGPIGNFCLLSQVLCALDRRNHSFHSEEGSQVSCVGGYDDQGEEPPDATNNAARERPGHRDESQTEGVWRLKRCSLLLQAHYLSGHLPKVTFSNFFWGSKMSISVLNVFFQVLM